MQTVDAECVETFETTRERLANVERQLAVKLGIRGNVRRELIERDRQRALIEDDLVADWHDLYASYLDWLTVVYTADGQSKRYKEDPLTIARKLGFNAR